MQKFIQASHLPSALLLISFVHARLASFSEVTVQAGIDYIAADKTSSPTIADLNQDGYLDIIQCNHVRTPVEIFYGARNGTFSKVSFFLDRMDRHGTGVADIDEDGFPDVILTSGFASATTPRDPPMIGRTVDGSIGNLELINGDDIGLGPTAQQGPSSRIAVRMLDADGDGDLDMFLFGRSHLSRPNHGIFEKVAPNKFRFAESSGIERGPIQGFLITDYNGDGLPDIIQFHTGLLLFRNDGNGGSGISFTDVSTTALPRRYRQQKIGGAAELDYDNDGDFDIYLSGGVKVKSPYREGDDIMLENNGDGTFSDVSKEARLPTGGAHMGITVADFDNNGFMDVFVPRPGPLDWRLSDLILFNNGDKTFEIVENHGANGPTDGTDKTSAVGAQAFDYDLDGRVDVVVASRLNPRDGKLRLFRNISPSIGNYITLQVPVAVNGSSSMDAIIRVTTRRRTLTRKVGSVGESRTQSFIDQVHVGIGDANEVSLVTATFSTGLVLKVANPPINQLVIIAGG